LISVHISRVYIDQNIMYLPETRTILDRLSHVPKTIISDPKIVRDEVLRTDDPITEEKKILFLTRNNGAF